MIRMKTLSLLASCVLFIQGLSACSWEAAVSDPPVPDPGGPFVSDVSPSRPLNELTVVESATLCRNLAAADLNFLAGAVVTTRSCRLISTLVAQQEHIFDPSLEYHSYCQQHYDECVTRPVQGYSCRLPDTSASQSCGATLGDLSACLNEIAALDPVGVCVRDPDCNVIPASARQGDGGASTDVDGASAEPDASTASRVAPPLSAMPACARLYRICPAAQLLAKFPC